MLFRIPFCSRYMHVASSPTMYTISSGGNAIGSSINEIPMCSSCASLRDVGLKKGTAASVRPYSSEVILERMDGGMNSSTCV
jgi:hypothetical protein